jgi:hypothetical protein
MNFDAFLKQIKTYPTKIGISPVAREMKKLINRKGIEIFKSEELLSTEINTLKLSKTSRAQLNLIFSSSTLSNYIQNTKSDMNMLDVDNMIHNVVDTTGLSYKVVLTLVSDILYACGVSFSIEYGPEIVDDKIEHKIHAMMPSMLMDKELLKTEKLIEEYTKVSVMEPLEKDKMEQAAAKAIQSITNLCHAGVPKAFYWLGRCYWFGECGTIRDPQKAISYIEIAAQRGIVEAAALLGDIYYNPNSGNYKNAIEETNKINTQLIFRDYSLAHYYYTRPGSLAMGKERQRNLKDILNQYSANRITLFFAGIMFVSMIVFLVNFHSGILNGNSRLVLGIIFVIFTGAIWGLGTWVHMIKPYNGIRGIVATQYFVWALYAFFLVMA